MDKLERLQPRAFTKFCMSIGAVPTSYLAGLTIEEQILWFCSYLEQEVIPVINNNAGAVEEVQQLYLELKDYVDNYFDNLDLTEEISNKLDQMAQDGTLTQIIKNYVDPYIEQQNTRITQSINQQNVNIEAQRQQLNQSINAQNSEIENQNYAIANMEAKIDSLTTYAPIPVSSTSDMTDTTKLYLLTTDGKWYYYDGANWTAGGTYQAAENSDQVNSNTQDLKDITLLKTYNLYTVGELPHTYEVVNSTTTIYQRTNINFEQIPSYYEFKASKYYFMWAKVKRNGTDTCSTGYITMNPYQQVSANTIINSNWYDRGNVSYSGMEIGTEYEISIAFNPLADTRGFLKIVGQNLGSALKTINVTFTECGILEFDSKADLDTFILNKEFKTQRGFIVVNDKIGNKNYQSLKTQVDSIEVPTYDTDIIFWGDSLTHGSSTSNFPAVCSDLLNQDFLNMGIGGETAFTVLARKGSVTPIIPANADPSEFTLQDINGNSIDPLIQTTIYNNSYVNPITIDGGSDEYTLARNNDGTYSISGLSQASYPRFIKFDSSDLTGTITVIFVGQNGPGGDTLVNLLKQAAKTVTNQKYVIMGLSSGTTQTRSSLVTALKNEFGNKFFDTGEMVSKYGMALLNLTPTETDTAAINQGQVPPSLLSDNVHFNSNGNTALGTLLAHFIGNLY